MWLVYIIMVKLKFVVNTVRKVQYSVAHVINNIYIYSFSLKELSHPREGRAEGRTVVHRLKLDRRRERRGILDRSHRHVGLRTRRWPFFGQVAHRRGTEL
jgi:hypothetical protein